MMRLIIILMLATFCLVGCGGGGSSAPETEASTTPLDDNFDSTLTGTYNVEYMDFFFSDGTSFSTDDLDQFIGAMTIDVANDEMAQKIEWIDSELGNYSDYSESTLSDSDPDANYDGAYYEIIGDYEILFYYDNVCFDGICFDAEMRLRKTSDNVYSLLSDSYNLSVMVVEDDAASEEVKTVEQALIDAVNIINQHLY